MTRRGLVVGKFSPLHRGHELLIQEALAQCDELLLLSYSRPEFPRCDAATRERWLRDAFPTARVVVLDPAATPPNDAADVVHRAFVADVLDGLGWQPRLVFTSETYGDGFAAHLAAHWGQPVQHVCVDLGRQRVPVSGTAVRADPAGQAGHLSPAVQADLVPRVCLLGPESSGKTTLALALGASLGATVVAEHGREAWERTPPDGGVFSPTQLLAIAREQVRREELACAQTRGWLVCDTSPLTTWVYAQLDHGHAPPELLALSRRRYDLTVVCADDFAFEQDGTRRDPAFSRRQADATIAALVAQGVAYVTARGPVDQRVRDLLPLLHQIV